MQRKWYFEDIDDDDLLMVWSGKKDRYIKFDEACGLLPGLPEDLVEDILRWYSKGHCVTSMSAADEKKLYDNGIGKLNAVAHVVFKQVQRQDIKGEENEDIRNAVEPDPNNPKKMIPKYPSFQESYKLMQVNPYFPGGHHYSTVRYKMKQGIDIKKPHAYLDPLDNSEFKKFQRQMSQTTVPNMPDDKKWEESQIGSASERLHSAAISKRKAEQVQKAYEFMKSVGWENEIPEKVEIGVGSGYYADPNEIYYANKKYWNDPEEFVNKLGEFNRELQERFDMYAKQFGIEKAAEMMAQERSYLRDFFKYKYMANIKAMEERAKRRHDRYTAANPNYEEDRNAVPFLTSIFHREGYLAAHPEIDPLEELPFIGGYINPSKDPDADVQPLQFKSGTREEAEAAVKFVQYVIDNPEWAEKYLTPEQHEKIYRLEKKTKQHLLNGVFTDPSKPQNIAFINQMMHDPKKRAAMLTNAEYEALLKKAQDIRYLSVLNKFAPTTPERPTASLMRGDISDPDLRKKATVDAATALLNRQNKKKR